MSFNTTYAVSLTTGAATSSVDSEPVVVVSELLSVVVVVSWLQHLLIN
ncbi:MAG: hypothetical protein IKR19_03000 [Acholeplasmatales bacterium]|nr:hypothetical protein [Acholeplasmatales bacterium]